MRLSSLVDEYLRGEFACCCSNEFKQMTSITEAVAIACQSVDVQGRRHSHQRRLSSEVLSNLERSLLEVAGPIEASRSFHGLHELVCHACLSIKGAGKLLAYDVSLRIGKGYLNLAPECVYLHAGAQEGASYLGLVGSKLMISDFPIEMHKLLPEQAEDFLCIYKASLARLCFSSRDSTNPHP